MLSSKMQKLSKQKTVKFILTLPPLLFFNILILFSSCNRQNTNSTNQDSTITVGDTVKELGKNLMVVYQDKKNNYWFGSWETGLYRYDGKNILHFTTKDGLCHNRIDEIKEDKFGNIFFNTSAGISKFDGQRFTTLNETSPSDNEWKLNPEDLWFKCPKYSGQVYRYDGKNLYKLQIPTTKFGNDYISMQPNNNSPYAVYCTYKDSKGNIWFGTATLGVCRYNGKTFDWILEEDVTEIHNGPANGVRSIIEDKDGYFWFNSMYRYNVYQNKDKSIFYSREKGIGSLDGQKDGNLNEYLSIAKDNQDELWIATYTTGVWRYNPSASGEKITNYLIKEGDKTITLFSIYKDNQGVLWLGTHESGVYKFNGKTFERFRM